METYQTIELYIRAQSKERQSVLREMYQIIKSVAPDAEEAIKYGMPTFVGNSNLVHFAAMKGHLGFYPAPSAIIHFVAELKNYSTSKGCIRFSYNEPLPKKLIDQIVKFRIKEDAQV